MSEPLGVVPNDGWTEHGVIKGVANLYPRIELSYRPFTVLELAEYGRVSEALRPEERARLMAGHLAGKIKSWDLRGPKDDPWARTAEGMLALKDPLFFRLWALVTMQSPPDELLDQSAADREGALQDAIKAAEAGRTIAEVREERLRKN